MTQQHPPLQDVPLSTLLYGAAHYQVKLWQLQAHQALPWEEAALNTQYVLLQGHLQALSTPIQEALRPGCPIQAATLPQGPLINPDQQPSAVLEIRILPGKPPEPTIIPPVTETRPWGSFTVLLDEPTFKLKQLVVKPGNRLSLQRHQHREEHWLIVQGQALVTLDGQDITRQAGEYIKIPRHSWHRLTNAAPAEQSDDPTQTVEIIELQLGDYFGEDDIERCEDDYGRQ